MTPEEIQAAADKLFASYDQGAISAAQLKDGLNDLKKGVQGYTEAMRQAQKQLGSSVLDLGKNLANGAQGASVFNQGINSAGNMASQAASQFGPLGVAIGAAIKVLTFFVSSVNEQADKLYEANQKLAETGLATAGGMTDVFNSMQKFSYGIGELGNMTKLLAENSQSLAMLGGTAAQGANQLADMAKGIKDSGMRDQYMKLGMSVDSINKGLASYTKVQVDAGRAQNMTTSELTRGAQEYLLQQDRLSKITGANADQLEKAQLEGQAIDAFKATLDTIDPKVAAEKMEAFKMMYAKGYKDQALAYANSVSGFAGMTKESAQQFMATGGQLSRIATDNSLNAQQIVQQYADASKGTIKFQQGLAKVGDTGETMGKYGSNLRFAQENFTKANDAAINQQDAQLNSLDAATDSQNKMRQTQMDTRDAFQSLINKGITPVTSAMSGLSTVINKVTRTVTGGPTTAEPTPTGKPTGPGGAGVGVPSIQLGPQGQPQPSGTARPAQVRPEGQAPTAPSAAPARVGEARNLLDLIGKVESGGNYNAVVGNAKQSAVDFSTMTLKEVADYQRQMKAQGKESTAVGKYQMISSTLAGSAKELGLNPETTKFTPEVQDQLAMHLLKRRGYDKVISGQISKEQFATNLSKEWASLPKDQTGKGYYDGVGSNRSLVSFDTVAKAIDKQMAEPKTTTAKAPEKETTAPTVATKTVVVEAKPKEEQKTNNVSPQEQVASITKQVSESQAKQAAEQKQRDEKLANINKSLSTVDPNLKSNQAYVERLTKERDQLQVASAEYKKQQTAKTESTTAIASATAKTKEQPKTDYDRALEQYGKDKKTAVLDATDKTTTNYKTALMSKEQMSDIVQKNLNPQGIPTEQAQQDDTQRLLMQQNELLATNNRYLSSIANSSNKLVQAAA